MVGPPASPAILVWQIASNPRYWPQWLVGKVCFQESSRIQQCGARGMVFKLRGRFGNSQESLQILRWDSQQELVLLHQRPDLRIAYALQIGVSHASDTTTIGLYSEYELLGWKRFLGSIYRKLMQRRQQIILSNLESLLTSSIVHSGEHHI